MNDRFLIPANAKQSTYLFGLFTKLDLVVVAVGLILTVILLYTVDLSGVLPAILALVPALTAATLVIPLPNYHNALTIISNAYKFFTSRQRFIWKGWCFYDIKADEPTTKEQKKQF